MQVKGINNSIGLILLLATAYTQAVAQEQVLTFKEAVEIALKNNVNLKQQRNQLMTVQANKLAQKSRFLPNVSLNGTYTQIDGQQFDQIQGVLAFTKSNRFNGSLDANVTLFEGFDRINSIKQSTYRFEAQQNAVARMKQQLIFDVSQQYLQILLNQELLTIAEDNLKVQIKILEQISAFVEAGVRALPDQYAQEAQVLQLEVLKIRSENSLRSSKIQLMQTLLLDSNVELVAQKPNWDIGNTSIDEKDFSSLYDQAMNNRPDLKQSQNLMDASKKSVSSATSGYYPTLTAFFSYGSNFSSLVAEATDTPNGTFTTIGFLNGDVNSPISSAFENSDRSSSEVSFTDQFFKDNLSTIVGVRLSIPIFDQFRTKSNRVASKVSYDNAVLNQENLTRSIYADVQNAYSNFLASQKDYNASNKQFEAAEKSFEVQTERYELGIGSLVDYIQANNTYVQGAASKAQSELSLIFQQVILDFNVGTLKFEDIP